MTMCNPFVWSVSSSERDESSAQREGLVDWSHLDAAYGNCVSATADASLSQLQQLHTALTRLVRTHAATRDKTHLLQVTLTRRAFPRVGEATVVMVYRGNMGGLFSSDDSLPLFSISGISYVRDRWGWLGEFQNCVFISKMLTVISEPSE